MLNIICLILLFPSSNANPNSTEHLVDIIYWEVKPFIFTNEEGNVDGIIPKIFDEADYYCNNNGSSRLLNYAGKSPSRKFMYNLLRSNVNYGKSFLRNTSANKAFWVPILLTESMKKNERQLKLFRLIKSSHMAVIVPRYWISLPNKIINGIFSCQAIFLIAFMLSALLSMIMWFIEHFENKSFGDSFLKGSGTGLWWSIVSMTTVGYGDVVPKSVLGRFVAIIWLIVGLLVASVMTATMTDVVSGVAGVRVRGKLVSVLGNSDEEKVAREDYGAMVRSAETYEEVIQLLRDGKVFAAMINVDIAAWYQSEIIDDDQDVPLRIVSILPANLYVNCYVATNVSDEFNKLFDCMYKFKDEIYVASVRKYSRYCHKELLYIGSINDLFLKSYFIHVLLAGVCGLFLFGVAYELKFRGIGKGILNRYHYLRCLGKEESLLRTVEETSITSTDEPKSAVKMVH